MFRRDRIMSITETASPQCESNGENWARDVFHSQSTLDCL